jgi:hypothetical protein
MADHESLAAYVKRKQREERAGRERDIARLFGTTRAQLIVLMKAKNGKQSGGMAALAARRYGLIEEDGSLSDKGARLLASARNMGF